MFRPLFVDTSLPLLRTTSRQPAAAAHRSIVPRLPGSRMLSHIRDNGTDWPLFEKVRRDGSGRENMAAEEEFESETTQKLYFKPNV